MTTLMRIPNRDTMRAVLVVPAGRGWHVGIGGLADGRIEGEALPFDDAALAARAAIELADAHDLLVLRCETTDRDTNERGQP